MKHNTECKKFRRQWKTVGVFNKDSISNTCVKNRRCGKPTNNFAFFDFHASNWLNAQKTVKKCEIEFKTKRTQK